MNLIAHNTYLVQLSCQNTVLFLLHSAQKRLISADLVFLRRFIAALRFHFFIFTEKCRPSATAAGGIASLFLKGYDCKGLSERG